MRIYPGGTCAQLRALGHFPAQPIPTKDDFSINNYTSQEKEIHHESKKLQQMREEFIKNESKNNLTQEKNANFNRASWD